MLLGFLMGSSRLAYTAIYRLPKAAFVPILVVWFGSPMQMGLAFPGLVVDGAMALAMYALFSVLERRLTGWAQRGANAH